MNNILQLKGHFEHKRNPRGFGPKNLPGNGSVSSEHINELISDCSPNELHAIAEVIKTTKTILRSK